MARQQVPMPTRLNWLNPLDCTRRYHVSYGDGDSGRFEEFWLKSNAYKLWNTVKDSYNLVEFYHSITLEDIEPTIYKPQTKIMYEPIIY